MTTSSDVELRLRSWMADAAPAREPAGLVDRVVERLDETRQRPSFLVRTRVDRPGIRPVYLSVALLLMALALLLVVVVAAGVGGRLFESAPIPTTLELAAPSAAPSAAPAVGLTPAPGAIASDGSTEVGSLPYGDALIGLADGRILFEGADPATRSALIWNPKTGTWKSTGEMVGNRGGPTTVLLRDGRVLLLGGDSAAPDATGASGPAPATAEIFDPKTGRFTPTGRMREQGWFFKAIRLADGRVLVAGGLSLGGDDSTPLATAEIFDPKTATFTSTGSMAPARLVSSMNLLPDGRVLVMEWAGDRLPSAVLPDAGSAEFGRTFTAELFDPATGQFMPAPAMADLSPHPDGGRWWPVGLLPGVSLPDGRVLYAGLHCREENTIVDANGSEGYVATPVVIYDPHSATFSLGTPLPHCVGQAMGLPDGRVFVTGWYEAAGPGDSTRCASSGMTDASEVCWSGIYDPTTGTTTMGKEPSAGPYLDLLQVPDGRVFLIWPGGPTLFH